MLCPFLSFIIKIFLLSIYVSASVVIFPEYTGISSSVHVTLIFNLALASVPIYLKGTNESLADKGSLFIYDVFSFTTVRSIAHVGTSEIIVLRSILAYAISIPLNESSTELSPVLIILTSIVCSDMLQHRCPSYYVKLKMSTECHEYYCDIVPKCGKHNLDLHRLERMEPVFVLKVLNAISHMSTEATQNNEATVVYDRDAPSDNIIMWCDGRVDMGQFFCYDPDLDIDRINGIVVSILGKWCKSHIKDNYNGIVFDVSNVCIELYEYSVHTWCIRKVLRTALTAALR